MTEKKEKEQYGLEVSQTIFEIRTFPQGVVLCETAFKTRWSREVCFNSQKPLTQNWKRGVARVKNSSSHTSAKSQWNAVAQGTSAMRKGNVGEQPLPGEKKEEKRQVGRTQLNTALRLHFCHHAQFVFLFKALQSQQKTNPAVQQFPLSQTPQQAWRCNPSSTIFLTHF